jgi:heptosyltransferase-2
MPILIGIKEKFPNSEITWVTKPNAKDVLKTSPYLKKVISLPEVPKDSFDILYNFDLENEATFLANKINAKKKYGFYVEDGFPLAFNFSAEYYLNTTFDDELKKQNKKTYQEMMFEVAELEYKKQKHSIIFLNEENNYASKFIQENNLPKENLIGIHMGASSRWPSKKWHKDNLKEFILMLNKSGYKVLLFGGENEFEEHSNLFNELKEITLYKNIPKNTLLEFASLVNLCEAIVCSDSMALHVSLALGKPTIGLFFCTSPNEVEDYSGLLQKVISPNLEEFFPEKMDQYSPNLTKSISPKEVLEVLNKILSNRKVVNGIIKRDEKILLIKRKNEKIHNGKWAFPGGILNLGENLIDTLKREIKEEVNLEIKPPFEKISSYSYSRPDGKITLGESYLITNFSGEISNNNEVFESGWFSLEDLEKMDLIENLEEEALIAFTK